MRMVLKIVAVVLLWTAYTGPVRANPMHPAQRIKGVSLLIRANPKQFIAGAMVPIVASFSNKGKLPLCFVQSYPARYTFLLRGIFVAGNLRVFHLRFGQECRGQIAVPRHWFPTIQVVMSGKQAEYFTNSVGNRAVLAGRFLDMTMPGEYRIQLHTKYGLQSAGSGPISAWRRLGPHLSLIQDGSATIHTVRGQPWRWPHGSKPIRSNWLKVTVTTPYQELPKQTLIQSGGAMPTPPKNARGSVQVLLTSVKTGGSGPISVRAEFSIPGKRPADVRLTGNPFADFAAMDVTGPSYPGEYTVVQVPRPHNVPFLRKTPTPLTAYGKWLAKNPAKAKLEWKNYTLKPGMVYKYAEPINLSCRFDLSLSGVYRVRVRLAHTHIWSPWEKIIVP